MTAQIGETLLHDGEPYSMCTEPLNQYFEMGGERAEFSSTSTANWRGYRGSWEIVEDRLYMVGLEGRLKDGSRASVETIFPGFPDRVFAHWYSDTIRVPQGKLLHYKHSGYASVYERDLFLTLEKGCLVSTNLRTNGTSENPTAPEGYGIGGMTVFPRGDITD